jgi:phosphoglucomutase/phosphomannomutase
MLKAEELQGLLARAESGGHISPAAVLNIRRWLTEPPFERYRPRLVQDIAQGCWRALDDAFYAVLEFGTGGRRGKMYPVGTNVLNARTIGESARGLADYVTKRKGAGAARTCVIARDTRHNSPEFAEICARVLVAAGFRVYLFTEPRSTPLLSCAVRHLKCDAGIMITASHNPPAYNGFKCYAPSGGQVIPPDDEGIIEYVKAASEREIPEADYHAAVATGAIVEIGEEIDNVYIDAVASQSVAPAREISIVYTPMHGVGESSVAAALGRAGFESLNILASQRTPDGDFPNVPGHVSNPELPRTLDAAIAEAQSKGAELVLASDPDADRIGVGLPVSGDPDGDWTTLDGNQIGAALAAFVIEQTKAAGTLRQDNYIISTLATSQMARALCELEGVRIVDDLLVGFKWIGEQIDREGPAGFLFAFEESHGYLRGTHCRDKDAASGSLIFAELAATVKARGQTVLEYLDDLYLKVGHFGERQVNKTMEGREGAAQIQKLMAAFRARPPAMLGGLDVVEVRDYQTHEIRTLAGARPLPEPSGDMMIFMLSEPGTRFIARPSGTEPKIKFYLFARTDVGGAGSRSNLPAIKARTTERLDRMTADLEEYIRGSV